MQMIGQNNLNSVNTILYYGPKKLNRMPFDFHKKITALMPVFCQTTSTFYKPKSFHVHILSKKRLCSQKHCTFLLFYFNFFHNKLPTVMLIFHQKMLFLLKLHIVLGHQSQENAYFLSFHEKIIPLMLIFYQKYV